MSDLTRLLERADRALEDVPLPDEGLEGLRRRRDRKRRNQRFAAGSLGMAIFVVGVWIATSLATLDRTQTPAGITTGTMAKTEVTFHDKRVPFGRARLWGIVESTRPLKCAKGREVVVFRQRGSEQDPKTDLDVAHATASLRLIGDHYKWNLILYGNDGPYYARVNKTESCRADTSRTFYVAFGGG